MSELSDRIKDVIDERAGRALHEGHAAVRHVRQLGPRAARRCARPGAPVTAVNILPDPAIRQELQEVSGWPTIPQVFVEGRARRRRGHHAGARARAAS